MRPGAGGGEATAPGAAALPPRAELAGRCLRTLKPGRGIKPDVLLVSGSGAPVVVKDFAERSAWVRIAIAPWLVRRELRIYRALDGVSSVPRAIGRVDALAFAIEYREGEPLSRALVPLPERFLDELESAISSMHERGVVHLDLRHRDNVLMDPRGHPVVVDFTAAMCFRPGGLLYRWYRPSVIGYDHRALRKWRARLRSGAAPTPRSWRRRLRAWLRRNRRPPSSGRSSPR